MKLEPIYGYGWSAQDHLNLRATPEPFVVRIVQSSEGSWSGIVETGGHEFEGSIVHLSNRHEPSDGVVNIKVEGLASGWARMI